MNTQEQSSKLYFTEIYFKAIIYIFADKSFKVKHQTIKGFLLSTGTKVCLSDTSALYSSFTEKFIQVGWTND